MKELNQMLLYRTRLAAMIVDYIDNPTTVRTALLPILQQELVDVEQWLHTK